MEEKDQMDIFQSGIDSDVLVKQQTIKSKQYITESRRKKSHVKKERTVLTYLDKRALNRTIQN